MSPEESSPASPPLSRCAPAAGAPCPPRAGPTLAGASPQDLLHAGDFSMEAQDLRFPADLRPPGSDLAAFCGNPNAARAELNGMLAASPAVSAAILPLNCCEAAEAGVISMQLPTPLLVMWRHQVGQGPAPPVMLDLANLPAGWSVSVLSGCTSLQGGCKPTDRFDSGLTGTLAVAGNFGGYQMSTCLSVAEAGGTPHPVIHSLRLWIPTTSAH